MEDMKKEQASKDAEASDEHRLDLPLSSNYHEVKVEHFFLDLSCSMSEKTFQGSVILVCSFPKLSMDAVEISMCKNKTKQHSSEMTQDLQVDQAGESAQEQQINDLNTFSFCLDCFALEVETCFMYYFKPEDIPLNDSHVSDSSNPLQCSQSSLKYYHHIYDSISHKQGDEVTALNFEVKDHYLKIFLPEYYMYYNSQSVSPLVVKVCYKTQPEGPSLMWTLDQFQRPCVFTIGHLLNNRSLFPSQDMPQVMSTWDCYITLADKQTDNKTVLMTGESVPEVTYTKDGEKVCHFFSSYYMPAATFALAVGSWSCTDLSSCWHNDHEKERFFIPRCRLFSPECLHEQSRNQLNRYLLACFEVLQSVLGPYPLKHLDILIVPENFDSLGMACPHLLFLSQSLLCHDLSMFARVAHELCHTWFGVLTGPQDWTEEWLTEGICCYLEDVIHPKVMKWTKREAEERSEVRTLLKHRVLKGEICNTPEDLQMLRPNEGQTNSSGDLKDNQLFVQNGLNPEKTLMQVHYLKGFFLLKHLEQQAGKDVFLQTLKSFTVKHLGKLFTSKLLDFLYEHCEHLSVRKGSPWQPMFRAEEFSPGSYSLPDENSSALNMGRPDNTRGSTRRCSDQTVYDLCKEWLDTPGIPKNLENFIPDVSNQLIQEVYDQLSFLKSVTSRKRIRRPRSENAATSELKSVQLLPEQLVLLLEVLIEEDVPVTRRQLEVLKDTHCIGQANAEIQHSWCELIIHRKATKWISDVEHFLLHHQALGVYLYGELMISECKKFQDLAHRCYNLLKAKMAEGPRTSVNAMLSPA